MYMRRSMLNKVIIGILIIMMTFNTSLSYATYTFVPGTNVGTVSEFKNSNEGIKFKVNETGVYSLLLLPVIDDYEWKYNIYGPTAAGGTALLNLAAMENPEIQLDNNNTYLLYSKDIPYFVFVAGQEYTIKDNGSKLINTNNTEETYVTIRLGTTLSTESTTYIETRGNYNTSTALGEIDSSKFQYTSYNYDYRTQEEEIAGVKFKREPVTGVNGSEAKVSLVQQLLTSFFVKTIGNGAMFLIGVVAGEPITIDKILFNQYSRTRLGFFTKDIQDPDKQNPFLVESGVLPNGSDPGTLNIFFEKFTLIAIVAYLIILLYMGIRIVLSSTGKDMAKYKKLFADWVLGILILFLFPYVIRYTIRVNDAIVDYIGKLRQGVSIEEAEIIDYPGGLAFPFSYVGSEATSAQDYMSQMKEKALETGQLMYALCWFIMIKELVSFLLIYIKRMLIVMFLIVIFPLVTISYAVDKIADGKSQAFNNWFKEFILNVFLQTFHAINYVVVMGIVFAVGSRSSDVNFIFVIIGITYVAQGDKIMRTIFSQLKGGGGGTSKGFTDLMKQAGALNIVKSSLNTIGNGMKNISKLSMDRLNKNDDVSKVQEYKAQQKWDAWNLGIVGADTNGGVPTAGHNAPAQSNVDHDVRIALSGSSTSEQAKQALERLSVYSNAGGETQRRYEAAIANLDDDKKQELNDLIEESDAIDAMEGMQHLSETEINAHLNVLIRNRERKGNFRKLDRLLESRGISRENQDKLSSALKKRVLIGGEAENVKGLRSAICTKDDMEKLRTIESLDKQAQKIKNRNANLKTHMTKELAALEDKIKNDKSLKRNKAKMRDAQARVEHLREKLPTINENAPLSLEDRKKLFEIDEQKQRIRNTLINKNAKLPPTGVEAYSREARVEEYKQKALLANGTKGQLTAEQMEIVEAQAILDGSDSGEFSLDEIWEASEKIEKARMKKDPAIDAVILGKPGRENSKEFRAQLAATVLNNQSDIKVDSESKTRMIEAAEQVIIEVDERESGVSQHILDEAGLKVTTDNSGQKTVGRRKAKDSVVEIIEEIVIEERKQIESDAKTYGEVVNDEESASKMKKKIFQERLDLTTGITKAAVAPINATVVGLASAAMYSGMASDYDIGKALGAATVGSAATKRLDNATIDFVKNRVSNTTNVASGIIDSAKKGELTSSKAMATILYGDDNKAGVITRNMALKEGVNATTTNNDQTQVTSNRTQTPMSREITLQLQRNNKTTSEDEYRRKRLDERKLTVERVLENRSRIMENITARTTTQNPITAVNEVTDTFRTENATTSSILSNIIQNDDSSSSSSTITDVPDPAVASTSGNTQSQSGSTSTENQVLTPEEMQRKQELEARQAAVTRSRQMADRFTNGIRNSNRRESTSKGKKSGNQPIKLTGEQIRNMKSGRLPKNND